MSTQQTWKSGDIFLVPNSDGKFTPGQVIAHEKRTLHSASCAFFDQRVATPEEGKRLTLELAKCFSARLVTPDGLDAGIWPVVMSHSIILPKKFWPYEDLLSKKKRGAIVDGTGIIRDFLDAFYGLRPWDNWYRSDFLDGMLLSPDKKPKKLILVKSQPPKA
jgi:hypothetical protein